MVNNATKLFGRCLEYISITWLCSEYLTCLISVMTYSEYDLMQVKVLIIFCLLGSIIFGYGHILINIGTSGWMKIFVYSHHCSLIWTRWWGLQSLCHITYTLFAYIFTLGQNRSLQICRHSLYNTHAVDHIWDSTELHGAWSEHWI